MPLNPSFTLKGLFPRYLLLQDFNLWNSQWTHYPSSTVASLQCELLNEVRNAQMSQLPLSFQDTYITQTNHFLCLPIGLHHSPFAIMSMLYAMGPHRSTLSTPAILDIVPFCNMGGASDWFEPHSLTALNLLQRRSLQAPLGKSNTQDTPMIFFLLVSQFIWE